MQEIQASPGCDAGAQQLVSRAWLAAHLDDPDLRIIEVSAAPDDAEYRQGHIPGALRRYWKDALWHATDREFPTPEDIASSPGDRGSIVGFPIATV
jgi:thiosulfate/3-mercaptopyruvate sulfurtransferase